MLSNILNYAFNCVLSRRLGIGGFATLSSMIGGLMILSIPASVLSLLVVKYVAVFHAVGDNPRIRRLAQLLLQWFAAFAALMLVVGLLLRNAVAEFLHITDVSALALALLIIAFGFITPSLRGILQGEQDFWSYSVSTVLEVFLKVIAAIALVYAGRGVAGAMFGWFLGTLCSLVYTAWVVFRKHGASTAASLDIDVRRLITTMLGVSLSTAILVTMSFVDVLLVKHYFAEHTAGIYAAVNLTGKVIFLLVSFLPAIVLPKAIARVKRGEGTASLLAQSIVLTVLMSGITLTVFGLEAKWVLAILAGNAFSSGAPYVFQYDIAMGSLAVITLLVNYNIAIHRFGFLAPLGSVLIGEIVAVAFFHSSLWQVVHILLAGNALGVIACCIDIRSERQYASRFFGKAA